MKQIYAVLGAVSLLAGAAMAQDETMQKLDMEKMVAQMKVVSLQGAVMSRTVKGAPYSGVEVNESTQVLADGTRIHNENRTSVYRDGEGRVRRESPTEVTIFDPVANASWILDPKAMTARKLPMGNAIFSSVADGKSTFTYTIKTDGPSGDRTAAETKMVESKMLEDKVQAEVRMHAASAAAGGFVGGTMVKTVKSTARTEALGKQTIEGVSADGSRVTSTIEAGTIGNDRPLNSVNERWFSSELQTLVMSKHTDPRTGEESFRLINVNRAEPASYLFQVPAGYQVLERK